MLLNVSINYSKTSVMKRNEMKREKMKCYPLLCCTIAEDDDDEVYQELRVPPCEMVSESRRKLTYRI